MCQPHTNSSLSCLVSARRRQYGLRKSCHTVTVNCPASMAVGDPCLTCHTYQHARRMPTSLQKRCTRGQLLQQRSRSCRCSRSHGQTHCCLSFCSRCCCTVQRMPEQWRMAHSCGRWSADLQQAQSLRCSLYECRECPTSTTAAAAAEAAHSSLQCVQLAFHSPVCLSTRR